DTAPETGRCPHRKYLGAPKPGDRLEQFVLASEQLSGEDHWHEVEENSVIGVDSSLVFHQWKVRELDPRP
ncbi:MAG TPA: class II glutamine amidotransferase, partial [Cystobacter sp.]